MFDLQCPSSGEQKRTCNFPWGQLAHVAQGYWRTVNSAQGCFLCFSGHSAIEQVKVHRGGQALMQRCKVQIEHPETLLEMDSYVDKMIEIDQ